MSAASLIGGPLDGDVLYRSNGSFPTYLGDDGCPVTARAGDRELIHRPNHGSPARWGYVREHQVDGGVRYIHHTQRGVGVWP